LLFKPHEFLFHNFMSVTRHPPNQSPEPTPIGVCSSAIADGIQSSAWLSFIR
jgi:hypothetical protein